MQPALQELAGGWRGGGCLLDYTPFFNNFQRKKINNFNEKQADVLSNRIIQKITKHFANHLKDNNTSTDESIELISKVFQLEYSINE